MGIPLPPPTFTTIITRPSPVLVLCRMQTRETQASRFLQAQHAIHRLHTITGSPLYQVIERTHHHHTRAMWIRFKAHITEIRTTENFGLRIPIHPLPLFDHPHKGFLLVRFAVYAPELSVMHGALQEPVRRREHTAYHLDSCS